ncbi:uncharacterized protein LOC117413837 [Acipenser ruthenus]|uniref:uncharacterized protein LOC117413837 n=1 Tax=Acipenser ruthenus TaxID=7906 RepID=UPI002740AB93|nr:uncharacterized protein LOC117413837 [Acipenser ruthenus]
MNFNSGLAFTFWIVSKFLTKAILLLFIAGISSSEEPAVKSVFFESRNCRNTLHWNVDGRENSDAFYSVQYRIYGKPWQNKRECFYITRDSCDLSHETRDCNAFYNAQVIVTSKNTSQAFETERFHPKTKTLLGPPAVKYSTTVSSLLFTIELPSTQSNQSLEDVFEKDLVYSVTLSTDKSVMMNVTQKFKEFEIPNLDSDTEYCGVVVFKVPPYMKVSEPYMFCTRTLKDNRWTLVVFVTVVFISCLIVGILCCVLNKYLTEKRRLPNSLEALLKPQTILSTLLVPTEPDANVVCVIVRCKEPKELVNIATPKGSYAPQTAPKQHSTYASQNLDTQPLLRSQQSTESSGTSYGEVVEVLSEDSRGNYVLQSQSVNPSNLGASELVLRDKQLRGNETKGGNRDCDIFAAGKQEDGSCASFTLNNAWGAINTNETGPLVIRTERKNGLLQMPDLFSWKFEEQSDEAPSKLNLQNDRGGAALLSGDRVSDQTSWLAQAVDVQQLYKDEELPNNPSSCSQFQDYLKTTPRQPETGLNCFVNDMEIWKLPESTMLLPSNSERPEAEGLLPPFCTVQETKDEGLFLKGWDLQIQM